LFVASTFAITLDPHGILNGAARSTDTGIEQDFAVTISDFDPSQFVSSAEKLWSFY
jgi:hypothetical protein